MEPRITRYVGCWFGEQDRLCKVRGGLGEARWPVNKVTEIFRHGLTALARDKRIVGRKLQRVASFIIRQQQHSPSKSQADGRVITVLLLLSGEVKETSLALQATRTKRNIQRTKFGYSINKGRACLKIQTQAIGNGMGLFSRLRTYSSTNLSRTNLSSFFYK